MNAPYPARDFSTLRGLKHISDVLLQDHLKLYEGYVKNVNLLNHRLKSAHLENPEWAEMKRRIGFEINGMRLHELYFENLRPGGAEVPEGVSDALDESWGAVKAWRDEFSAMGSMRGIGWAILYLDPVTHKLSNHWIELHEKGHPAGFTPLLVMDVWEHAYTGMERARYIAAFLANVDWYRVQMRRKEEHYAVIG